jgi:hypothetical protein
MEKVKNPIILWATLLFCIRELTGSEGTLTTWIEVLIYFFVASSLSLGILV